MAIPAMIPAGTVGASATSDVSPGLPTHAVNTVLWCVCENSGDVSILNPTGGSLTWSEVPGSPVNATGTQLAVFWARCTGASETGPTVSLNGGDHILARIFGSTSLTRSTGVPYDFVSTSTQDVAATAVSVTGGTTTTDDCMVVAICSRASDASGGKFTWDANATIADGNDGAGNPFAESNNGDFGTAVGDGGGLSWAHGGKATAGTVDACTATMTAATTQAKMMIGIASLAATTVRSRLMLMGVG